MTRRRGDPFAFDNPDEKGEVLAVVTTPGRGSLLLHASKRLRGDYDVVLAAVTSGNSGDVLQYASTSCCGNRELVLAAVHENGVSLEHATRALQSDRDIAFAAVDNDPEALYWVSEDLRDDDALILTALDARASSLRHASRRARDANDVVIAALRAAKSQATAYTDGELVIAVLDAASDRARLDPEVVEAAGGTTFLVRVVTRRAKQRERERAKRDGVAGATTAW